MCIIFPCSSPFDENLTKNDFLTIFLRWKTRSKLEDSVCNMLLEYKCSCGNQNRQNLVSVFAAQRWKLFPFSGPPTSTLHPFLSSCSTRPFPSQWKVRAELRGDNALSVTTTGIFVWWSEWEPECVLNTAHCSPEVN